MFLRTDHAGPALLAVTDRYGGSSAAPYDELNLGGHVGDDEAHVGFNRWLVAEQLGVALDRLVLMRQVHGNGVAVVERPWPAGGPPEADALVTAEPGLALAVLVADCAPVLLASFDDGGAGVVGVAHAGRRGMAGGIVAATVAAMRDLGADPAATMALVGPTICGRCYEVPEALQEEVSDIEPSARSTTRSGSPALDVRAGVVAQLRAAGVGTIEVDPTCTAESAALYSYRRDGATGRFAGLALLAAG
jgi:YfiH family protein